MSLESSMVSRLMPNVPGTTLIATSGTAFAEVRAAKILQAATVEHLDPFKWLDASITSLAGLSAAEAQVLATRGVATLRDVALAPPALTEGLAPGLLDTLYRARTVIRAAAERHGVRLVSSG